MTGSQISAIILAVTVALLFFITAFIFVSRVTESKRRISARVTRIQPVEKSVVADFKKKDKDNKESKLRVKLFKNRKLVEVIADELILADIMLRPEEFVLIWLLLAFIPSGLIALFSGNLMSSGTLAVFGAGLPLFIVRYKKKKRTQAFELQLSDALVIACNCVRSGLTFQQAMETIAKDMSAPISVEFGRVTTEIKYGKSLEKAMENMTHRIKSPDLMLTVSAVNIQRQTGGNLSEILETISETIKERIKIKSDVRALTAQGRISGMIVGFLPIAIGGLLMVINPNYIQMLFSENLGRIMIGIAVAMETIGIFLIRKVVNIKY